MADGVWIINFTDNSKKAKDALEEAAAVGLEEVGLQAENYAKMKCPVDTGKLRNSINHAVEKNTVYIGTAVEYAPYVEMGTSKMAAQPFLQPAAENHTSEYLQILEEAIQEHLSNM